MNRRVILTSRPAGIAQAANFGFDEQALSSMIDGDLRIANRFLSVDPAMRGWIADAGNYSSAVPIGDVMRSLAVGEILESRHPDWREGQIVLGWFGWQEIATVRPDAIVSEVSHPDLSPSLALGVLGINGVTALLALTMVGEPKAGDTLVVSTGAGSVGSAVGQIGGLLGCRTVGIAGGSAKVRQCIGDFGFDAAIDYKAVDLGEAVANACPDGVDIYFDNTSGAISDAIFPHLAMHARVVNCGTAAIDRWDPWPTGPRVERHLLVKRARMQGFVVFDHFDRWEESVATLAQWVREGKLRYREELLDGLEMCPDALAGLYRGENAGKRVIRL
jgi:NADPH-dependent curcumin reductase